ncbi:MAG: gliding motility lipoprotein GldJ [Bacteroidetes bacterium GWE2_40_63]|nr:MAG: gliding motility lipoprotein GldJ [Bacteroidetes bacterium GWA2_40_14]OFX59594.1 MAG: gliding motility lipoprotein GldJ [Bacteroidetes bacterium GWC2_40_13]OFX73020.1 MAG: gliding motility lipoprotein GldJ [Bacteroidetes bacterium GWD2_40_43]OFX92652.1 MAG: gliding motility lipoprotein GldJ [Bacteroidetes bacterium GWE2_40_63]OFY17509.1 MAG: gliding motility lipoprotein GldJ [Bacteroidetes bacterium GWF2_40_13]OFZ27595.1 MAG: gliding motility lipoprotein GldJ [Bacteroidetes bacterium R
MMKLKVLSVFTGFSILLLFSSSCSKQVSQTTGWEYNNPDNGGFEYYGDFFEQETGPGLVFIEGGSFTMGRVEQDITYDWNNIPRTVTVSSFYMDETEVKNVDYREYLYWISRVFIDYPEVYKNALPDTLVWRRKLAYNEPMVEYYFRHPAYGEYPVVGVNWLQANDFCAWRTDRVNEDMLIAKGILLPDPNQQGDQNFNTDAYLAHQYEGAVGQEMEDLDPNKDFRKVRMEDGILLPKYRLPTEAEWEYAALALIGTSVDERVYQRRIYPWNGDGLRNPNAANKGKIMANNVRGRGDMMGVAGALNDNADITAPVHSFWPNDFGLYCMAGNVNEWVMDVYRPLSAQDVDEFRPFRGNVFETLVKDEEGNIAEKDSLGRLRYREITEEEAIDRRNYLQADNINYLDGDFASSIDYDNEDASRERGSKRMYKTGKDRNDPMMTSLVSDHSRVYKGGSWRDRTYWLGAGTRRYLNENLSQDDLGFRCAMIRVGGSKGN